MRQWVINELSKSGWTMNEFARRSKLSSGYVSQVLSGIKKPGPKFYQGMAKAFGVTLESVERAALVEAAKNPGRAKPNKGSKFPL